jgi:hypothetical protein
LAVAWAFRFYSDKLGTGALLAAQTSCSDDKGPNSYESSVMRVADATVVRGSGDGAALWLLGGLYEIELTGDVVDRADATTATRNLMAGSTAKRRQRT